MSALPSPIAFEADITAVGENVMPPEEISHDVPCTDKFNQVREGFVSLGFVSNRDDIAADAERQINDDDAPKQEVEIKSIGDSRLIIPDRFSLYVPFVSLVAGYEKKFGSNFLEKSATLIVKNVSIEKDSEAEGRHRDPPSAQYMSTHNIYSFASAHPTEFMDSDRQPEPFEVACFTPGSIHRRPTIQLENGKPLRRIFAAVVFSLQPKQEAGAMPHYLNWRVNRQLH